MIAMLIILPGIILSQDILSFNKYHNPAEVQEFINKFKQLWPDKVKIHTIAVSPGGEPVRLIEISGGSTEAPAIFTGANFEGNVPLATEGALMLARMLMDSVKYTSSLKWFILPLPNPDASNGYFRDIRYKRKVNDFPVNNDTDEAVNEDGYDDLNGDGFITLMRKKCPDGTHIISVENPEIMIEADKEYGE